MTSLKIFGVSCTKEAILNIVLGENLTGITAARSFKSRWFHEEILSRLQIPAYYRSPLCFSLLQLDVLGKQWRSVYKLSAFLLLNIPHLQAVNVGDGVHAAASAMSLLRNGEPPKDMHELFNSFLAACETVSARAENWAPAALPLAAPPAFSGKDPSGYPVE